MSMTRKRLWNFALFALLFFVSHVTSTVNAESESSCEETLKPMGCDCIKTPSLQISCLLNENQNLLTVLETIGNSSLDNIDKVTIRKCLKPVEVLESLPMLQIRSLAISNCGIKRVHERAFDSLTESLEVLNLVNNSITTLPFLKRNKKLQSINLSGNLIMNLPNLVELRLSSNRIKDISPYAFKNIPKLKRFLARDNLISNIDGQAFQGFKDLESIDLSGNAFFKIPSLKDIPNLLQLKMSNNSIKKIEATTFSGNKKLELLTLDNNQISEIGRSLGSLNSLTTLNLANNNLEFIERTTFDSLRNLKVLILRANQIVDINGAAFSSTPNLVIIDLTGNRLQKIHPGTFAKLSKVYFLSLSNNSITTIERGAFESRIGNVLIDGNPLNCDNDFDLFVTYLVKNNIKTFLPNQPDIKCASPPDMEGKRLREMMIEKVNESKGMAGQDATATAFDPNFLSGLLGGNVDSALQGNILKSIPGLHALQQSMPFIKEAWPGTGSGTINRNLSAMNKQDQEIVIDISKVPPKLIEHVLRGGNIPGIPRENLDRIIKQHMERMYYAAARAQEIEPTDVPKLPDDVDPSVYLMPIKNLPQKFLTGVMNGGALPHLTPEQTNIVKEYYIQRIIDESGIEESNVSLAEVLSPKAIRMLVLTRKMMPPGYDLSKMSPEVMKSVMAGELPDMSLLPRDLQKHIVENLDELLKHFSLEDDTVSIDDILSKLPEFPQPEGPTYDPYDLVDIELGNVIRYPKA
ncbi:leucine rich repeat domain-containing protein [Ditylenchus destructor]|uniref:Leucine rich repeat domain-containing protein n=1 Tax=Ditylenchus destructor TaxID=166010 RepID=A0AAD4R435_9BILA|nr:leucine rich repeat domain-containing protein [Ditylenchus destructor]